METDSRRSPEQRVARVRALAKINLDLRVLEKRADGYHELRTIFQTVSLADSIEVRFTPARRSRVSLECDIDIPDNLMLRAADRVLAESGARGVVEMRLAKRIPMGGGLGGGSTDAAAVLLALPALSGRPLPLGRLMELAAELGSDVPFFLLGGTAVGLGRGEELYPLADSVPAYALIVDPGVHVSTGGAYQALDRGLTSQVCSRIINSFRTFAWGLGEGPPSAGSNDFEEVVFAQYPRLGSIKRKLLRLGARAALLTGSGGALFGLWGSREEVRRARDSMANERAYSVRLVGRKQYRAMWSRALRDHITQNTWPPQSRYAR